MKLEACLLLLLNTFVAAMRRGPHHPHDTPVEQRHHHYRPKDAASLTSDTQMLHDTKHIEEDSGVLTPEMLAKMSPEELDFHYFSAHDFDKNSKLDGLELLKAVYHTIDHEAYEDSSIEPEADLDHFISLVDRTLALDDKDRDGFVSYVEYREARQNSLSQRTPHVLVTKK